MQRRRERAREGGKEEKSEGGRKKDIRGQDICGKGNEKEVGRGAGGEGATECACSVERLVPGE